MSGGYSSVEAYGSFTLPPNGYVLYIKIGSQPWTVHNTHSLYPSVSINNPTPNVVYAFRMEAYNASNQWIATSNADAAMIFPFTGELLLSGQAIQAQHVQELIAATNILRNAAGLPPLTLPGVAVGQPIRHEHLTTLRTAFDAARTALGLAPITHSAVPAGSTLQARHLQDLRDAIR